MRQRRNYGFERRNKDAIRRAKQESKRQRKSDREASGAEGPEMGEAQVAAAPPGMLEWFSPSRSRTLTTEPGARPQMGPPDDWLLLTDPEPTPDGAEPPGA